MEQGSLDNYYEQVKTIDGTIVEEEEQETIATMQGLCPKCLNSGFLYTIQEGVLGIVAGSYGQDSAGKVIKRLRHCNRCVKTTY